MERQIQTFDQDDVGDWRAILDCGHGRHFRHQPPFFHCAWVESAAGRSEKVGMAVDCPRCDRLEWPDGFVEHKRTPLFDQDNVPKGLLKDHTTKAGVWAQVHIRTGALTYAVATEPSQRFHLDTAQVGIIPPQVPHHLELHGPVTFQVVFFRQDAA